MVGLLIGCGGRVIEDFRGTPDSATVTDTGTPPAADAEGPGDPPLPTDAGPGDPPPSKDSAPPTTSLAECFGEMGKSNPSTLKDLFYNYATCTGEGCFWRFRFNVGCNVELGLSGSTSIRAATTTDEDCILLRNWATSERLLNALNYSSAEAKACMASYDMTRGAEDTSVGGTPYGMKTMYCPVEPFTTHRRCMQMVIAKYFPPK
jgi:hypothetical protein